MSPEDMARAVATVAGVSANGSAMIAQLRKWIESIGRNAVLKWPPRIRTDARCGHPRCQDVGATICDACGQPTCLVHARVGINADAICESCVQKAIPKERKNRPGTGDFWGKFVNDVFGGQVPGGQPTQARVDPLAAHYAVLGLNPNAGWDAVVRQFRALSKRHHPDRGGSEQNFKRISEAYNAIRVARGA